MNTPAHLKPFTAEDFEIVDRQVKHQGLFRYVQYQVKHRLFKGGWTPVLSREVIERSSAAGILPYDPVLDQVVLISQFRPGAITHPYNPGARIKNSPWLIEIVAGVLGKTETPPEVARREAEEEAGCHVLDLHPINDYFVSPGGTDEYLHLYCGRVDASGINGTHGLEEDHEDIYAFSLPAEEAFKLMSQGMIKTAPALIALQWLQLHRHFLRDLWLQKKLSLEDGKT